MHQHVAAADIQFIGKCQGDRLGRKSLFLLAVAALDGLNPACPARGQHQHFLTGPHHAGRNSAAVAAEIRVWPVHILHGKAKVAEVAV